MQSENKFIDDLSKVASSAMGVVSGLRDEAESVLRARLERILSSMDLVTREEFETVKEMAIKAREENEALHAKIAALEAKAKSAPRVRKATKKTPSAKSKS